MLWSRVEGLDDTVRKIAQYCEENRAYKMQSFYAQAQLWGSFFYWQGLEKKNPYLMERSITELVFYASRYILAENRILFPCHKTMMEFVDKAPNKPENYIEKVNELLKERKAEQVSAFLKMFKDYAKDELNGDQCVARFIEDSEWNWLENPPPLQDC